MERFNFEMADVLVVDDQASNIQLIYQVLHSDYNIYMARSGAEALELIKTQRPDIILLDVYMPELSGLELCRMLKGNPIYCDIPIIFITSFTEPEQEVECWEAGGVDFVQKPINQLTLSKRVKAHLTLKFQADVLKRLVNLDGLTGIYNRRYFDEQGAIFFSNSQQTNVGFSVVMFDIDYFKDFNDRYGHLVGDDCLKKVSFCINRLVNDDHKLFARYGGEEFILLISEASLLDVKSLIESICNAVAALKIPHESSKCSAYVTVSAGAVYCDNPEIARLNDLVEQSDVQLYRAKDAGRNQVFLKEILNPF
ncbi:diguanylate cyclase domain-containing protein [Marinomonas fungiae]|uniref:diguanylate cyclase n=1 Tax=Marinomonas fungiae TaxID=1137284 RepID=A0A0K6IJT0_9GAMM|nr:diguanylate cyclase [Marinomonas fungiae]CUB03358.1 response regulator receiver modulated diguanylate cyclase [Marinomonas fungiae]